MISINEKLIANYPKPISIDETKIILNQMKTCVCRVCRKDGVKGTGFFCKIPLSHNKYFPAFITNNHIIDEIYLSKEDSITLQINNGQNNNIKSLSLKNKFNYTERNYDITIIEINENIDGIYEYLELDDNILNDTINYIGNSIYILHYPNQNKVHVSYGILKNIIINENYSFTHYCSTDYGSSGSPIISLENNKVIGIHTKRSSQGYNIGSFLYYSIKEFIQKYKQKKVNINLHQTYPKLKNLDKNDKIMDLFCNLYNKGLATQIIQSKNPYKYGGLCTYNYTPPIDISEKRILILNNSLPLDYYKWIPAWHGTQFKYLESIIEYGLKLPGSYLKSGNITPNAKDIPFTNEVLGINNWENAIFASPNIHYALKYCDIINAKEQKWTFNIMPIPENWGWKGVLKIRIRPNSFSQHKSEIVIKYFGGHFCNDFSNQLVDIYRITSENNVIIEYIAFINLCDIIASNVYLNDSIK